MLIYLVTLNIYHFSDCRVLTWFLTPTYDRWILQGLKFQQVRVAVCFGSFMTRRADVSRWSWLHWMISCQWSSDWWGLSCTRLWNVLSEGEASIFMQTRGMRQSWFHYVRELLWSLFVYCAVCQVLLQKCSKKENPRNFKYSANLPDRWLFIARLRHLHVFWLFRMEMVFVSQFNNLCTCKIISNKKIWQLSTFCQKKM